MKYPTTTQTPFAVQLTGLGALLSQATSDAALLLENHPDPDATTEDKAADALDDMRQNVLVALALTSPDPEGDLVQALTDCVHTIYKDLWSNKATQQYIDQSMREQHPISFEDFTAKIAQAHGHGPEEPIFQQVAKYHWQKHRMIQYVIQQAQQPPKMIVKGTIVLRDNGRIDHVAFDLEDGRVIGCAGGASLPAGYQFAPGYKVRFAHDRVDQSLDGQGLQSVLDLVDSFSQVQL